MADFLHLEQRAIGKRMVVALPLFGLSALLLWYNIADSNGFNTIWRYFGWSNQTLAPWIGLGTFVLATVLFYIWRGKQTAVRE